MKKHTLQEIIEFYDPRYIEIKCGEHTIEIDIKKEGSWFLIRTFQNEKFSFVKGSDNIMGDEWKIYISI